MKLLVSLMRPVEEGLRAACGCDSFRIDWRIPPALEKTAAALDSVRLIPPEPSGCPDRIGLRLRGIGPGGRVEILVSGEALCRASVWLARRALRAGGMLQPSDVAEDRGWYPPSALRDGERETAGTYLRRSVPRGRWIGREDLGEAPLVRRGADVRVLYLTSGLRLEGRGVARRDAGAGEPVTVRLQGSEHDCEGVVSAENEVVIHGDHGAGAGERAEGAAPGGR